MRSDKNRLIYSQSAGEFSRQAGKPKHKRKKSMKNLKTLALGGMLGLVACGIAIAQVHPSGTPHQGLAQGHGDAASIVKHFAEVFPKVAAFDVNKDGKLDDTEKAAMAKAIADGTLELPAHTGPNGEKLTGQEMASHVAEMYAYVAVYDINHDGVLDETEQAAIKKAIENGEFAPHGKQSVPAANVHQ
jgi:hypothetical protein